jgi:TatD DNase family protein
VNEEMLKLVDTHAHFEPEAKSGPWEGIIVRANNAGVEKIIGVGGSDAMNDDACRVAARWSRSVVVALGYDRSNAGQDPDALVAKLRESLSSAAAAGVKVVAIGEIGLDFHHEPTTAVAQAALMERQLALARELGLPVIVHTREADGETLRLLREHGKQWKGEPDRIGVVHSFTGSERMANALMVAGFCIGFSGIVTFRNAEALRKVVPAVSVDRLLIETDSPFLAPVPMRGHRNEPSYLRHTVAVVAELRGTSVLAVGDATTRNACRVFGI